MHKCIMSSEEVAQLAQAIHNHADVLYESWKKGQEALQMKRMEDTLELLADPGLTPKLEHLVSTFVRRDKEKRQHFHTLSPPEGENRRESSPGGRKPLPKSILAVVQRFEAQQQNKRGTPPPSNGSIPSSPRERSPAPGMGDLVRMNIPGVGPVSKNVLWSDTMKKQSSSERIIADRGSSPTPIPVNITTYLDSNNVTKANNGITKTIVSHTGKVVRERHIPIERMDDVDGKMFVSPNDTLKHEEESLIRALKSGHASNGIVENGFSSPNHPIMPHAYNHNSRVAYAKERIRQSQENPLTQQRLEIQKRLPFPSGNLAAAIAMQQGKQKFQPNGNVDDADHNNHPHRENARNNIRFGPGATVADRVQLFEKYPTHVSSPLHGHSNNSGSRSSQSPIRIAHNIITHPIYVQLSNESNDNSGQRSHSPTTVQRSLIHENGNAGVHKSHQTNNKNGLATPVIVNPNAPWRTSPSRDIQGVGPQQSVQPSESKMVTSSTPSSIQRIAPVVALSSHPPQQGNLASPKRRTKEASSNFAKELPRFYFPEGKPTPNEVVQQLLSKAEEKLKQADNGVTYNKFGELLTACGIPLYWKKPFWMALCLPPDGICSSKMFLPFIRYLFSECSDEAARFIRILSSASRNFPASYDKNLNNNNNNNNVATMNARYYNEHGKYCLDLRYVELTMADFIPMMQDIIDTHPGLGFLRDAPEFHSRYITTVISRIFYKVNRSWSGRLTLAEIRRSNLLRVIRRLEEETDINTITDYFSYEHFYVIYCKFWELDKDHDLLIDKHDLAAHSDHALSNRIIDRIFSGTVLRGWDVTNPTRPSRDKMTYSDFVWFLLSEEDKKTSTAIEYWFRCLDIDGDGVISPYELQHFYSEQESRIESLGIEPLHFTNVYCQIVDMLRCSSTGLSLRDLKKNPHLAANVFNTVFNLDKYLEHEQRDPFAAASMGGTDTVEGESDWDRYAAAEYELLIAEESPTDHIHDSVDEGISP